jgi:dTDP-4-amino-4,6-dideoxygalactose transaminase
MKVQLLDLKAGNAPLLDEINLAIREVIEASAFAGGPFVTAFEKDFAEYTDSGYAAGVGSGTDALFLALLALGIGPGDDVITVPNSFIATAEAISYVGANPVFVDVDPMTYTMDPSKLKGALTPRTKAIIPVHLFGQTADMDPILAFAKYYGLPVIEDAAQAHGAKYKGRVAGTLGDMGCFSFYPGKNLGAFGEAGAVVTDSTELNERVTVLRDHGQIKKYYSRVVGWNGRMDGIQAAVLRVKLRSLERGNRLRREHAAFYTRALKGIDGLVTPREATYASHVYHVYAVRVAERDALIRFLDSRGIGTGVHYPVPIHLQEAYAYLGGTTGDFPIVEKLAEEFLSLPIYPELRPEQLSAVVSALKEGIALSGIPVPLS